MATYSTDFSEYTTGQAPADWTERWHSDVASLSVLEDEELLGGKHLKLTASAQNRYRATWDILDSDEDRADFEILAKGRIDESTGQLWVSGRISGGTTSETSYSLILDSNVNQINLHRYDNASSTNLTAVSFAPSVGTWYWIRFQCIGTALKGKVWVDGDDEPETWTTETTDSALADAGAIGIGTFRQFDQSWDFFSVGTGGDPAPGPSGGTDATATPSGVSATGSIGTVQVNLDATVTLTGVAGTGAVGTATVALDSMAAVEGVSATGAVGSVTVNIGGDATATPAGVSATGAVGDVAVVVDGGAAVTGVSATGAVGTVTVTGAGDAVVPLTGIAAEGQVGTVAVAFDMVLAVAGVAAAGQVGAVTVKLFQWEQVADATETWTGEGTANDVWTEAPKASGAWSVQ